jgi:hypothetical protein
MTLIEMLRANGSWEADAAVTAILVRDMRIEKLEAALASVLRFDLTDETWVKLGFDPLFIRDAFDADRKTLEGKDD